MFHKLKTDYISWLVLVGTFIVLVDVLFFNRGLIFSLVVTTGMIYIGRKRMPKKSGKLLFWAGLFFLVINLFNMFIFKIILIVGICYLIFQYAKKKQKINIITPEIVDNTDQSGHKETIFHENTFLLNKLFGSQQTPDYVYEWNDVNIQVGVGNTIIDLSYTVLPKQEAVILIRNLIGNVTILIPYDMEVCVQHSVFFGSVKIFDYNESSLINRSIKVETGQFVQADQRVKIVTSTIIGDIEVKRV